MPGALGTCKSAVGHPVRIRADVWTLDAFLPLVQSSCYPTPRGLLGLCGCCMWLRL